MIRYLYDNAFFFIYITLKVDKDLKTKWSFSFLSHNF